MAKRDLLIAKLSDEMDPDNAVALVDEVLAEAFVAGFDFAMNGHDKDGEYLGGPVEDGFAEWRK